MILREFADELIKNCLLMRKLRKESMK